MMLKLEFFPRVLSKIVRLMHGPVVVGKNKLIRTRFSINKSILKGRVSHDCRLRNIQSSPYVLLG